MANETAFIPEYIFMTYDGVIKNYRHSLLKKIISNHSKSYSGYIDIEMLSKCTDDELMGLCVQSLDTNILKYLAISEFNYDKALIEIYNKYDTLFTESSLLKMGININILRKQSFTKKIFIWTPTYDKRIHQDIISTYTEPNGIIEYISGNFTECIDSLENNITSYIINDISLIPDLIAIGKIEYSEVLVADYGYNYTLNDEGKPILKVKNIEDLSRQHIFKIGIFTPFNTAVFIEK